MKIWSIFFLLICLAGAAHANPVVYPSISDAKFLVVLVSTAVVEVSMMTLILFCFDLSIKPMWIALFIGNMIIYYAIFLPLLDAISSLLVVEGFIVAADGILIKVISSFDSCQQAAFKGLSWKYVFIIAAAGNIVSYYLGFLMQS